MKFRKLSEMWLENVKSSLRVSTYNRYYEMLNWHLYPEFENVSVTRITQQSVADFYIRMQTNPSKVTHRPYSSCVIDMVHTIFCGIMKYGKNTLKIHCIIPQIVKIRRDFDSEEPKLFFLDNEIQKVVRRLYEMKRPEHSLTKLGILISLFHGLRIGEVCGLRWEDIDFENKMFNIRRTASLNYDPFTKKSCILVRSPKTKKSIRQIPINDSIFEVLKMLRAKNFYSGFLIRDSNSYKIPNAEIPCSDATLRTKLKRILNHENIDHHRFHCLRHTFASHAIACGAGPKTVSVVLGHSSVNFTLNVYVHPSEEEKIKCMNFWQLDLSKFFSFDEQEKENREMVIQRIELK